jgi:hypothetical protein
MGDQNNRADSPREIDQEWTGDAETLYKRHRALLLSVPVGEFRLPEADAKSLVYEVLLEFVHDRKRIKHAKEWLVAALSIASRHYWRAHRLTVTFTDRVGERAPDRLADRPVTAGDNAHTRWYLFSEDFSEMGGGDEMAILHGHNRMTLADTSEVRPDARTPPSMNVLELFVGTYANL